MPRGVPKKGQFSFKVWWPEGGGMEVESRHNLDPGEWASKALKYLDDFRAAVIAERDQRTKPEHTEAQD